MDGIFQVLLGKDIQKRREEQVRATAKVSVKSDTAIN